MASGHAAGIVVGTSIMVLAPTTPCGVEPTTTRCGAVPASDVCNGGPRTDTGNRLTCETTTGVPIR